MSRFDSQLSQQRWQPCINVGDEEIPPFAPVQIAVELEEGDDGRSVVDSSGFEIVNNRLRFKVRKHDGGPDAYRTPTLNQWSLPGDPPPPQPALLDLTNIDIGVTRNTPIAPGAAGVFTLDFPTVVRFEKPPDEWRRVRGTSLGLPDGSQTGWDFTPGQEYRNFEHFSGGVISPEYRVTNSMCVRKTRNVPDDAVILLVSCEFPCYSGIALGGGGGEVRDETMQLVVGGALAGANVASSAIWAGTPAGATSNPLYAWRYYTLWPAGGADPALTPADVLDPEFGFALTVTSPVDDFAAILGLTGFGGVSCTVGYGVTDPIDLRTFYASDSFLLKTTPWRDGDNERDAFRLLQTLEENADYALGIFIRQGPWQ